MKKIKKKNKLEKMKKIKELENLLMGVPGELLLNKLNYMVDLIVVFQKYIYILHLLLDN